MTAKTSQKLADTLRAAGLETLAGRAEADEFHDYLSEHAGPSLVLDQELMTIIYGKFSKQHKEAARNIRNRHHQGEFDASSEESDEWAASPEGQATFTGLLMPWKDK